MSGSTFGGKIEGFRLREVLQLLRLSRRTGSLFLHGHRSGRVDFHEGRILRATVSSPYADIGTILMHRGGLKNKQLKKAVRAQKGPQKGMPLGRILVSLGFVTDQQLRDAMREQVDQVIQDLLEVDEGDFHFRASSSDEDDVTQDVSDVLLEADMRRMRRAG